ncbi:MAG: ATP-dependent Clp protease ATP-binding subunit [Candidatus Eremiobacteraeota bacterium]|nr:ATP-dependent Clp protease ATP-binding subunit [Candidatus Eremiobacteraeota bacterium]
MRTSPAREADAPETTAAVAIADDRTRLARILDDPVSPRWLRELHSYLAVKSQFVLYGNVRDRVAIPVGAHGYDLRTVTDAIVDTLALRGYEHFCTVDPLHGVTALTPTNVADEEAHLRATILWAEGLGRGLIHEFSREESSGRTRATAPFPAAVEFAERVAHDHSARAAVVFDYLMGSQFAHLGSFLRALIASYEAEPDRWFNPVFWLADRENDLPPWLSLGNPRVRVLSVARPDKLVRRTIASSLLHGIRGYDAMSADQQDRIVDEFTSQTDGMMLNDLSLITNFCADRDLDASRLAEGAFSYELGTTENPWARMGRRELIAAETRMRERVCGQEAALTKTLDIIRRALKGLSGAQQSGQISVKPKGVLFFAGPTGVGKTELAKSLTEGLFGDERSYIRFDMSEFNHEHADQRLIGAPPGYIGFDAGGELTDAVRERPCSVILFDEIEKAHGRILDKFLQILDEGQLTSGKGERVYFSDSIIVFTSNLGITSDLEIQRGKISYSELEERIRRGVTRYFKEQLGRPELLNRIGDNIVVFNFISPEVAEQILDKMLRNIVTRLAKTQKVDLRIDDAVRTQLLMRIKSDLSNGGRGIGNALESLLINPLGRVLWELDVSEGMTLRLTQLAFDGAVPVLQAERL